MLKQILVAAGYNEFSVRRVLGYSGILNPAASDIPFLLRRCTEPGPLPLLIRLFLLGSTIDVDEASNWLERDQVNQLQEEGFVEERGHSLVSPIRVVPWEDLLLVQDRVDSLYLRRNHVTLGPVSRMLADLTVRRSVDSALDLGTGCGVQALLAARHAGRVVATDVNSRALRYAQLNMRVNGVPNIECRKGSLFKPVAGERFDLIVANLSVVISPTRQYVFQDSDLPGHQLSQSVVCDAPEFLREGGFAIMLCNWIREPGDQWFEVPTNWVKGRGCDAWLLHYGSDDPLTYAAKWNDYLRISNIKAFSRALDLWLDYYRREKIELISTGMVIMRRRHGNNWVRADEMFFPTNGAASDHVLRVFGAEDYLQSVLDDASLLDDAFEVVGGVKLDQTLFYCNGEFGAGEGRLVLQHGVGLSGHVLPEAIHVLLRLDGRSPLRKLIMDAAAQTGLSEDELRKGATETIRTLFGAGFLHRRTVSGCISPGDASYS